MNVCIGDTVRINYPESRWHNSEGVVLSMSSEREGDRLVAVGGVGEFYVRMSRLERVGTGAKKTK